MTSQNVEITPRGSTVEASGGCSCCSSGTDTGVTTTPAQVSPSAAGASGPAVYQVAGMTCGHCVRAVREEVAALDGVSSVEVALVVGGPSTLAVTSSAPVSPAAVAAAVEEAGYHLLEQS